MRRWFNRGWSTGGLFVCGVVLAACSRPEPQAAPVAVTQSALNSSGLVAAYAFDEGTGVIADDASGNSNTGTLPEGVTWSASGKHGGAASFDGSSWITVEDSASLDLTTGMTVEAWVNANTMPPFTVIVAKETEFNLSYALYASDNADGGSDVWAGAWVQTDDLHASFTDQQLPLNEWVHVAMTYDDANLTYYINGVLSANTSIPGPIVAGDGPLHIGGDSIWGEWFDGLIDDVRIYNRALSAEEIATDMGTPVGSSSGGCTGVTVDDGNPCTTDACDSATGTVTHTPVATGTSCSDGNACNGAETCNASATCVAGTPPTVDDGNVCTTDACDAATGVTHVPVATGTSCSDGNVCNGSETCDASGTCTPGTPLTVNDGNPCTLDACSPTGGVTHTPVSNGTSCADANVCNGAETCQGGTCTAGTPLSVNDNNPCTDDSCDPTSGVAHSLRAAGSSCSDFDLCNGSETCDASGTCQPGTPVTIDTSNVCNTGTCDPATGVVTYTPRPQGTSCLVDVCNTGSCNGSGECTASGSTATDDGNPCTLEWCDPVRGPQQTTCSTLDRTVGTTLNNSLKWLYTGTNPIQQGVALGTIQTEQAVALRGRVTTRDGGPLSGVTVTILSHPEFGHTLTQSNGYFDMVVNGGGTLVVDYQRAGYLRLQRSISSQWNDYASLPDVVMIPPDPVATTLDMTGGSGEMQVAQATVQTDESGTRQGVLLVPAGTQASMHLADGTVQPLDSMNVRITEYTVGPNGDKAMPGTLPGASKYTYAFDVNADEAVAANAASITFDTPVVYYTDNFLLFPAGTTVPVGFFDATASQWKASDSGVVIEVVGVSGGRAELDVTGDHVADPPSQLATFGITDAELQKMAEVYAPGRTLWRVQLPHFTPWDENWGGGPPSDSVGPIAPPPHGDLDGDLSNRRIG